MFFAEVKKGLVKTVKMMYNVSNTYYTTLFLIFQGERTLFYKKRGIQMKETERRQ